jgi:hypothetical protein
LLNGRILYCRIGSCSCGERSRKIHRAFRQQCGEMRQEQNPRNVFRLGPGNRGVQ